MRRSRQLEDGRARAGRSALPRRRAGRARRSPRRRSRRAGSTTDAARSCSRRSPICPNIIRPAPRPRSCAPRCPEIGRSVGAGRAVVEFGSGIVDQDAAPARRDRSPPPMCRSTFRAISCANRADALAARFPGLPVYPVEADFMQPVALPDAVARLPKLGFFPGSTIGNMIAARPRSTCCARCASRWARARCC